MLACVRGGVRRDARLHVSSSPSSLLRVPAPVMSCGGDTWRPPTDGPGQAAAARWDISEVPAKLRPPNSAALAWHGKLSIGGN
ncbi:hypothetical protein GUJ93_ZPchr0009g2437 [Zizania palustris]|uniref:Uncharacterized protein n=1 Tax=Zizania palustris TaxID=103762 RepID=A0A8J5RBA5_ZIZPA|nr:hypothetical protein GUJ93_ZPchr0009g2437 [Zizania palustris]